MQPFESQPTGTPPTPNASTAPGDLDTGVNRAFGESAALVAQDPYKNPDAILEFAKQRKKLAMELRWVYERVWWRDILYVLGRHWIYYDKKRGQWLDKRMAQWVPRPTTNFMASTVQAIRSVFSAVHLASRARPLVNDPKAVTTAETADRIEPLLQEEHKIALAMHEHDFWFIATGNAFLQTWWNPEKRSRLVQDEQCSQCQQIYPVTALAKMGPQPTCPACGGREFEEAFDEDHHPIGQMLPLGGGETDVLSPFEIALPPGYTRFEDMPFVIRLRWRQKEWIEDNYDEKTYKGCTWETMPADRSLQLVRSLATQSDISSSPLTWSSGESPLSEGLPEFELWQKPCKKYEKGLVCRVLGDGKPVLIDMDDQGLPGPLPYRDREGVPFLPFQHSGYEDIGGRVWARGALDPLIEKQNQINQGDALAELAQNRMSNPIWLSPKGSDVKSFTGQPGLVVQYTPNLANINAKPERIPGENIPQSIFTKREMHKQDIEELAGTFDIIKGQKPTGVEAFSALQLLVERSQSRFGPALGSRGRTYRGWYKVALELERAYGPDTRVRAVMKPNRSWSFDTFKNASLDGSIEIVVEDGSDRPKTSLGERAAIEHANQLGLIDKNDPEQKFILLGELGLQKLSPSLDYAVKSALQEQDEFEKFAGQLGSAPVPMNMEMLSSAAAPGMMGTPQAGAPGLPPADPAAPPAPVDPATGQPAQAPMGAAPPNPMATSAIFQTPMKVKGFHKHRVHITEHEKWAVSDSARELFKVNPMLEAAVEEHLWMHKQREAEDLMREAMLTAAPQGPAGGVGAGRAMGQSNSESTSTSNQPSGSGQGAQQQGPA